MYDSIVVRKAVGIVGLGCLLLGPSAALGSSEIKWNDRVSCHLAVEVALEGLRSEFSGREARPQEALLQAAAKRAERVLESPFIGPEALSLELDRILSRTRDPRALSLLFEAVGGDHQRVLECIVRPIVADRVRAGGGTEALGGDLAALAAKADPVGAAEGDWTARLGATSSCSDDSWALTSTGAGNPSERNGAQAVWTGAEMIVWGGIELFGSPEFPVTGGIYVPATDSWLAMTTQDAPAGRTAHVAFWTGTEMLVWGGVPWDGALYDPMMDDWSATSTSGAPSARSEYSAVWTGAEMTIWGGASGATRLNDGARYNPATDSWMAVASSGAPSVRWRHNAVWTGSEMIIWGGANPSDPILSGGRYDPMTNSWGPILAAGGPAATSSHSAWTGQEMLVWDGSVGGRYTPADDSWADLSDVGAPAVTLHGQAVWNGWEWILWGGEPPDSSTHLPGGRYDPRLDQWAAMTTQGSPQDRFGATAVWTGRQAIFWGGANIDWPNSNVGGLYCAATPIFIDGFESGDTGEWLGAE